MKRTHIIILSAALAAVAIVSVILVIVLGGGGAQDGKIENFKYNKSGDTWSYSGYFANTSGKDITDVRIDIVLKDTNGAILRNTYELVFEIPAGKRKYFEGSIIYTGNYSGSAKVTVTGFKI